MADGDGATPAAAIPDPLWDDGETPLTAPAVPVLHLDGFDGPMDLLLDLAQRQLIDLGRLSIVVLAQQFVAELEGRLRAAPIDRRADWLVVAARLLQLRSRLLFPTSPAVAADARRDAARTLAALEAMRWARATANWLDARAQLGRDVFVRPHGRSPRTASYMALMDACLTALRGGDGEPAAEPAADRVDVLDFWRVGDALAHVRARLEEHLGGDLMGFVPKLPEAPDRVLKARAAIASTLVACLELAKTGELRLDQRCGLGGIDVSRAGAG